MLLCCSLAPRFHYKYRHWWRKYAPKRSLHETSAFLFHWNLGSQTNALCFNVEIIGKNCLVYIRKLSMQLNASIWSNLKSPNFPNQVRLFGFPRPSADGRRQTSTSLPPFHSFQLILPSSNMPQVYTEGREVAPLVMKLLSSRFCECVVSSDL